MTWKAKRGDLTKLRGQAKKLRTLKLVLVHGLELEGSVRAKG